MARQARAIQTRHTILEAAGEVFDERGYDAATIAEILSRAGVTKGALYFHFTSKEDLARGVLGEALTVEGVLPQDSKLQEWVDAGMVLAHRLPREPLLRASITLSADQHARALLGTSWPGWIDYLGALLRRAKDQGELLPHIDPQETAALFVGAWTGVEVVNSAISGGSLEAKIAALYDHVLPGVAVPGVLGRLDTAVDRGARMWRAHQRSHGADTPASSV